MPITQVQAPDGSVIQVEHPEGASQEQILQYAYLKYLDERDMAPVPEGEVPTPMEEPVGPSVARPELGAEEQLIGALETIASLGSGMTTGLFGTVGGTLQGLAQAILSGELGSPEAARLVEQYASRGAEAGTYAPRTEAGQRMTQAIAEPLSQLPPLLSPSGVGAPVSRAAAGQARLRAPGFDEQMARAAQMADEAASRGARAIRGGVETFGQGVQTGVEAIAPVVRRGVEALKPKVVGSPEDVAAARQAGIRVMTTDVVSPETFAAKWLQSGGEKIPFAGTGGQRAAQQRERVAAVENLMREYEAPEAVPVINRVAEDLLQTRSEAITRRTNEKQQVINGLEGTGPVPVERTIAAIDAELDRLSGLRSESVKPVIDRLTDWRNAIQGQSIANVEALRKQIGESFKAPELAAVRGTGEASLSRIYGPLREDMTDFVRQNAGEEVVTKWRVANKRLSNLADELKVGSLKTALRKADQTPETVGALLFSNKPSDNKALFRNLSSEGKQAARIAIMNRAAQKAGGIDNISPDRFLNELKRMGDQVGIFFPEAELTRVNGLMRALELTKRGGEAGVAPPTGVQAVPYLFADVLSSTFGGPMAATAIGVGLGGLARFYESRPVRGLLTALGKAKKGSEAERRIFTRLRTEAAKASKKFLEQSAPDAQVARELAKRAVPATVPETARTQLRELEESDQ